MANMADRLDWAENIWVGVTMETAEYGFRIDHLRSVPARLRFLSIEPLLGPVKDLDLTGVDWVIVGGESGPGARPMKEEWVLQIKDICEAASVPFFFKQWGGVQKKKAGRLLEGKTWDARPFAAVG